MEIEEKGHVINVDILKQKLSNAVEQICQECFLFVNYVTVTGRIAFKVDDVEKTEVNLSQMVMPGPMLSPALYTHDELHEENYGEAVAEDSAEMHVKSKRGRKRKIATLSKSQFPDQIKLASAGAKRQPLNDVATTKRKRGRPRKSKSQEIENVRAESVKTREGVNIKTEASKKSGGDLIEPLMGELIVGKDGNQAEEESDNGEDDTEVPSEPQAEVASDLDVADDFEDEDYTPSKQKPQQLRQSANRGKNSAGDPLQCGECDQSFTHLDSLKRHKKKAHSSFWQCPLCETPLNHNTKKRLLTHLSTVHQMNSGSNSEIFPCDLCKMVMLNGKEAQQHNEKMHTFKCDECSEVFRTSTALYKHRVSTHPETALNEKSEGKAGTEDSLQDDSIMCPICGKRFVLKGSLQRHLRWHTGLTYTCPLCQKKFVERNKFKIHLDRHHGDSQHQIDIEATLDIKGKYMCDHCDKIFDSKVLLREHVELRHAVGEPGDDRGIVYRCLECKETFKDRGFYQDHMATWHVEDDQPAVDTDQPPVDADRDIEEEEAEKNQMAGARLRIARQDRIRQIKKRAVRQLQHTVSDDHRLESRRCQVCDKVFFSGESMLLRHARLHKNDGTTVKQDISQRKMKNLSRFKCDVCRALFSNQRKLRLHKLFIHEKFTYGKHKELKVRQCAVCNKVLSATTSLTTHMRLHSNDKFQCHQCVKSFVSTSLLRKHIQVIHEGLRFYCTICGNKYTAQNMLKKHMKSHDLPFNPRTRQRQNLNAPWNLRCYACNLTFDNRKQLIFHRRKEHLPKKKLICEFCGKSFDKPYALRHHVDFKHRGIKHKCDLCPKSYSDEKLLKKHLHQHETGTLPKPKKEVDRTPYCKICDKWFADFGCLTRHSRMHNGNHLVCETCGKTYTEKSKLRHHVASVHMNVRWHCSVCNKDYATERYLKDHMQEHNKQFAFHCHICGKGFASRPRYTQHISRHRKHKSRNPVLPHWFVENKVEGDTEVVVAAGGSGEVVEDSKDFIVHMSSSVGEQWFTTSNLAVKAEDKGRTFEAISGMLELQQEEIVNGDGGAPAVVDGDKSGMAQVILYDTSGMDDGQLHVRTSDIVEQAENLLSVEQTFIITDGQQFQHLQEHRQ